MNHPGAVDVCRPIRPTGSRARPRGAVAACALAVCLVAGGCTDWFGDENTTPARFEVVVANHSDQPVYHVFGDADADEPTGRFSATRSEEASTIRIGVAKVGDDPGGCFDNNLWVLTSRSGQSFRQGDISEYAGDLEVIRHFSPGECTEQEQIIVEYDGP